MNKSIDWKPKKHSKRVEAWIYTVINPIVECLQRELELLATGNLSWRFYSLRCEFIRPIQEYVDSAQWPNYSDFLLENQEFKERFQFHDSGLDALNNSASALFSALISNPQFLQVVESSCRAYEEARKRDPMASDLTDMRQDISKYAAEYLIDNYRALPAHYNMAKFWTIASDSMHTFRSSSNLFGAVQEHVLVLKGESQRLSLDLEHHRLGFARSFDIPAAPVPNYFQRR
jgi:hypothetical protein